MPFLSLDLLISHRNNTGWVLYLLEQLTSCPGWRHALILDLGSNPDERSALEQCMPGRVQYLPVETHLGVPAAWNEGWRHSNARVLALMDGSLRIRDRTVLSAALRRFRQESDVGVIGIEPHTPPLWHQSGKLGHDVPGKSDLSVDCDMVSGAYLFRREVGPFDETFDAKVGASMDHCLRAREKGFRVVHFGQGVERFGAAATLPAGTWGPDQQRLQGKWARRWPLPEGISRRDPPGSGAPTPQVQADCWWKDEGWEDPPHFGRRETLLYTLGRLRELHPGPVTIVETGTLRGDDEAYAAGDGWSTLAWGWYCRHAGGRVYTIDINAYHLAACRRVTAAFAEVIEYVESDSVAFLQQWAASSIGEIDLLYLDSLDYFPRLQEASEEHHRREAQAALPALSPQGLVLIDDTEVRCRGGQGTAYLTGKGAQAIPLLLQAEFLLDERLLRCWPAGQQVLLFRNP